MAVIPLALIVVIFTIYNFYANDADYSSRWGHWVNFIYIESYIWLIGSQVIFLLPQGFLLARSGQTIGKRLLNIAIVDIDTRQKPPFGKLYFRRHFVFELLLLVSTYLITVYRIVDFASLFKKDRRTIHDLAANTIVMKVREVESYWLLDPSSINWMNISTRLPLTKNVGIIFSMNDQIENPYSVPQARLGGSTPDMDGVVLASVGQRIGARCIDLGLWILASAIVVIIVVVWVIVNAAVSGGFDPSSNDPFEGTFMEDLQEFQEFDSWTDFFNVHKPWVYLGLIFGQVIFLLLQGYLLVNQGQTIGKYLLKIRIVDRDTHQKPAFGDLYLRRYFLIELLELISTWVMFIFRIVDFLFLFKDDRRTIHDMVANTIVIKDPTKT